MDFPVWIMGIISGVCRTAYSSGRKTEEAADRSQLPNRHVCGIGPGTGSLLHYRSPISFLLTDVARLIDVVRSVSQAEIDHN